MDVLIIGCGYLGSKAARLCLDRGDRVFATTRQAKRAADWQAGGLSPIVCDVLEPASLKQLPRVDVAIHCVGLDRQAGSSMRSVYVDGLRNVLEALPSPGRFVYVSSTSVYGQTGGEAVDETAPTLPLDEGGRIALAAENELRGSTVPWSILRFAGIYGPGRVMRLEALKAGESLAVDPRKWLNLIHGEDGARALLAAAERGRPGQVYNVSDGHPVSRGEFYAALAEALGIPGPVRFDPPKDPKPRDAAHRRVLNDRLVRGLACALIYPTFRHGLRALASPGTTEPRP